MPTRKEYRECLLGKDTPTCYKKLWTEEEKAKLSAHVKTYWD